MITAPDRSDGTASSPSSSRTHTHTHIHIHTHATEFYRDDGSACMVTSPPPTSLYPTLPSAAHTYLSQPFFVYPPHTHTRIRTHKHTHTHTKNTRAAPPGLTAPCPCAHQELLLRMGADANRRDYVRASRLNSRHHHHHGQNLRQSSHTPVGGRHGADMGWSLQRCSL